MPSIELIPTGGVDGTNARRSSRPVPWPSESAARSPAPTPRRAGRSWPPWRPPGGPVDDAAEARVSGARGPRLAGRNVLVTGSTGLAASAATAIAAEGGSVFAVSRTAAHLEALAAEVRAAGGRCEWHAADLRAEDEVEAAFAAFDAAFGRLDAVYSVAGISARRFGDGPIHEATLEGWETVITANATSQFLVARAAVRRMLAQAPDAGGSRGSILLMSSTLATRPVPAHFATHGYAASKARDRGPDAGDGRDLRAGRHPGQRDRARRVVATPMSRRAQDDEAVLAYLGAKQPLAAGPLEADAVTAIALASAGRRRAHGHGPGDRRRRRLGRRRGSARIGNSTALPRRTVAPYRAAVRTVRLAIVAACLAAVVLAACDGDRRRPRRGRRGRDRPGRHPGRRASRSSSWSRAPISSGRRRPTRRVRSPSRSRPPSATRSTSGQRVRRSRASPTRRAASPAGPRSGPPASRSSRCPSTPVAVELDQAIESQACSATATPDRPSSTHRSNPTPPATDRAADGDGATPAGRPFLAVAALAFVLAGIAMVAAWRSRSAGR